MRKRSNKTAAPTPTPAVPTLAPAAPTLAPAAPTLTALTLVFILADQFTKFLAAGFLKTPIKLIDNFLILEKSLNSGIAFGIQFTNSIIICLTVAVIILLIYLIHKNFNLKKPLTQLTAALILGGAFGNLIDRIFHGDRLFHGQVIDFIKISFGPAFSWPNFNLADVFIVAGCIAAIFFYRSISQTAPTPDKTTFSPP